MYGGPVDVVHAFVDDGNLLDAETGRLLASIADRACENRQRADCGMWVLEERRHYSPSKLGCRQALDCAVHRAEFGLYAEMMDA